MKRKISLSGLVFLMFVLSMKVLPASAQTTDPYDLIAAVNALRVSKGAAPLEIHTSLMTCAQEHADYQASIGTWTHEGPGGSIPADRAEAAGYGDGKKIFIAENVAVMRYDASLEDLIFDIWADEVHWNTMTSPIYTHVGAGITKVGDSTYYTLDVGYISGQMGSSPEVSITSGISKTATDEDWNEETPVPVFTATQHDDGTIIHIIEPGQAVWSIALAYGKSILDIAGLNKLDPGNPLIYAGQEIIIQPSFTMTVTPTVTRTLRPPTKTPQPTYTPLPPSRTPTVTLSPTPTPEPLIPWLPTSEDVDKRTAGILIIVISGAGLLISILWSFLPRKSGSRDQNSDQEN